MSSASTSPGADFLARLERDGYVTLSGVFSPAEVQAMLGAVEGALASTGADDPAIRGGEGTVYAARNLIELWPGLATAWRRPALVEALVLRGARVAHVAPRESAIEAVYRKSAATEVA